MNLHRDILRLAVPSILANITVPLVGMVDIAVAGHLGATGGLSAAAFIGGISIGTMLFDMLYWNFGFLRMGSSGLTAQALGRRDLPEVGRLLLRSMAIALGIAFVLLVLQVPLRLMMFWLIGPTADVQPSATTYFYIVVWGAPASLGLFSLSGWYIGMLISITQNVINILVSLLLVYGFGMKIEGVALGTVIAQYAGFLMAVGLFFRYYGRLRCYLVLQGTFVRTAMSRFFHVNRDIFLRTLCLVLVNLFFTSAGARHGAVILSVNTVMMQLYLFFSYFMDGFANAGEALSGKYFGAGNRRSLRDTIRHIFIWGGTLAVAFTFVYVVGGKPFLGLLTDEPSVVTASSDYVWWAYLIPFVSMGAFMWDGIFIGLTASRQMLQSMFVAAVTFFVLYYLLQPSLGNHGLWAAFLGFLFVRGLVQTIICPSMRRQIPDRHQG